MPRPTRRKVLTVAAGLTGSAALGAAAPFRLKGRLKQSICLWCFRKHWSLEEACRVARQLGMPSVELVDAKDFATLKKHGLVCAMATSHPLAKGFNNPKHHAMCVEKLTAVIDACAAAGFPNVVTFTGNCEDRIAEDVATKNCVAGLKKIAGYAEKKGVTLCLENLNSRIDHRGYQGDRVDYCIDIIKQVGSPRLKLLFDIYHAQIMDGDLIRRLREHKQYIGHVHTAGNPGRHELDDTQEIAYRPIMQALVDMGYEGYVGQEFLPTRDPLTSLREAVALCDA
jgi:hydroxypyruvate isomerase